MILFEKKMAKVTSLDIESNPVYGFNEKHMIFFFRQYYA